MFQLLVQSIRLFRLSRRKEATLPVIVVLLILLSLLLDENIGRQSQPVSFLTVFIVICCVTYYNWLHMPFGLVHDRLAKYA